MAHLRAVPVVDMPAEHLSEAAVLRRVMGALEDAVEQPSLSTGWRVAFQTCQRHLASVVEPRSESPRQRRRQALR